MKPAPKLLEAPDRWIVPIEGWEVVRCFVDQAFGITFLENRTELTITLYEEFTLVRGGAKTCLRVADSEALGPALSLLQKKIRSAEALKCGTLELTFCDGDSISAGPNSNIEAWQILGTGGLRVVSMPGGELAIWDPKASVPV